jgi:hypothetical protein
MTVRASKLCSLGFPWKAGAEGGDPVLPLPVPDGSSHA